MRKFVLSLAAASLIASPAYAGEDKSSPTKAEREAAEERERAPKCKDKRERAKEKCKASVPTRGETPSSGPLGRAYGTPFL